jgi:reactive intermediate/imine deaminase
MSARKVHIPDLARLPAFCHAVVAGPTIYVSGTLGTRGASMELAPGGVGAQTRQALENVERILAGCGATLADLVKVQVYLADIADFAAMNEAYVAAMGQDPPARITVGRAALALGALVEIDAIAYREDAGASNASPARVLGTREGYDLWSEIYDQEENPLVELEERHRGRLFGDVEGRAVADIGCGTGRHALWLARAGARVTAVDYSEGMLARAQVKPGAESITFVRHDLTQPFPLPAASFDRVVSGLVVDHIPDPTAFFAQLGRLCRPGGRAIISVMHPAMMLRGVQARFPDPRTGVKTYPASIGHQMGDYVMAASRSGLSLAEFSEHPVDEALAAANPRAAKYLGWPMLLLVVLERS